MTQPVISPNRQGRWKAAVIGAFVCWQLFFLPAANLVQFVPLRVPVEPGDRPLNLQSVGRFTRDDRLQSLADIAGSCFARYAELSGQEQFWKLFCPEFPPYSIVLVVRIEWADGRHADVDSQYAPAEVPPAFRLPRRDLRPFYQEANIALGPWTATLVGHKPEAMRQMTVGWAGTRTGVARATMLRSWCLYRAEHPDSPEPDCITLLTKYVAKPALGTVEMHTSDVTDRPFVRWNRPFGSGTSLEAFDPVSGAFVPLPGDRP